MTDVRLGDGSRANLVVGSSPATVSTPGAPVGVEFHAVNPSSSTSSSVGAAVVFTTHTVAPGGGGSDNGTGGFGQVIGGSIRYRQRTPAATWSFRHPLGRTPQVTTYIGDLDGDEPLEQVDTSVEATDTTVVVTWPYPMSGELIVQ